MHLRLWILLFTRGLLFLNLALFTTSPGLVTFSGQFCMESRKIIVTLLIFVDLLGYATLLINHPNANA